MLRLCGGGAPVLCCHTQQAAAIAVRHEVDRLGAAGSASNESRSLDHLLLMHTLVGAAVLRRMKRNRFFCCPSLWELNWLHGRCV